MEAKSSAKGMHISPCMHFAYFESEGIAITSNLKSSAQMFEKPDAEPIEISGSKLKKYRPVIPWGENNDLPNQIIEKIYKSEIVSSNISFLINLTYGSGIEYGKITRDENGIKKLEPISGGVKEIDEFFEFNDIPLYGIQKCTDIRAFFQSPSEHGLNNEKSPKIVSLTAKQMVFSRWEQQNPKTGFIENMFYSAKWAEGVPTEDEISVIPVLNPVSTIRDALTRLGRHPDSSGKIKDTKERNWIVNSFIPTPGRVYNPKPYWWSIFESGWYDFATKIAAFKNALMNNMATLKYHIQLSEDYFEDIFAAEAIEGDEAQRARILKEYNDIKEFLGNSKNSGKALFSYFKTHLERETPKLKIEAIPNHFKGGEYIEDSEETSNILSYSMGVHPSMVGAAPGKNKSINGTEARELFIIAQAILQSFRDRLLKDFYVVKAVNKWPKDVGFTIPNLVLTTLDKNTGSEKQIS